MRRAADERNLPDPQRREHVERAYRDHSEDLYRVAYAVLHDPEAAADAVHEAFARAYRDWHRYDSQRPLRPWLHAIVSRVALDALRRRRVRVIAFPMVVRGVDGSRPHDEYSGEDPSGTVVARAGIEQELARLQPQARAALVLRHYYGYGYAEIGAFLGTSSGNVGSMLSRAHATLRGRLAASGGDARATEQARGVAR